MERAQGDAMSLAFSRDGAVLATGCGAWDDNNMESTVTVQLYSFHQHRYERTLRGRSDSGDALAVAFSPAANVIAALGEHGDIFVWNWQTGHCLRSFHAHTVPTDGVIPRFAMAFSPNGLILGTGTRDEPDGLRLWSAKTWNSLGALGSGPVAALLFCSPT